jgi:hypothetical protein
MTNRLFVVALVACAAALGCATVYEFDGYGPAETGGGGPSGTSSSGGGGAAGGSGGAGSGGGGAASACTDGVVSVTGAWSTTLGPFEVDLIPSYPPRLATALDGDRLVFATVVRLPDAPALVLGGREVLAARTPGFVVGWIDDTGTLSNAFVVEGFAPQTEPGALENADVELAIGAPGIAYLTLAEGKAPYASALIEIDVCAGTQRLLARCYDALVPRLAADAQGRLAWAVGHPAGAFPPDPDCAFYDELSGCEAPPPPTMQSGHETMIWLARPTAPSQPHDCSGARLDGQDVYGTEPHILADDAVQVTGSYASTAFSGSELITSPHPYSSFFAVLGVQGTALVPTAAYDTGKIPQGHAALGAVQLQGGSVLFAVSVETKPNEPDEPVFANLPSPGYYDVLLARRSDAGVLSGAQFIGDGGADFFTSMRATTSDVMLAARTYQTIGSLGACNDPGPQTSVLDHGCAVFATVDSGPLAAITPLVLDAPGALDVGYAGYALPGGDRWIVGATGGALPSIGVDPIVDGARTVYFARVAPP